MSPITSFQTVVVGADHAVGESLTRLLALQSLPHQAVVLESRETLKAEPETAGFIVLAPSPYQIDQLEHVAYWLQQANTLQWPVLLVSSLGVFPEQHNKTWKEDEKTFAASDLAKAYLAAEILVQSTAQHFIVRAGLPLYLDGNDFASRFLAGVREQQNWALDSQALFHPTASNNIAEVVLAMLQQANCSDGLWGIYHYCDVEAVSAFQFAQFLLEQARHYEDIPAVVISALEGQGEKPRLWMPAADCTKIFHVFGIRPKTWRQGLVRLAKFKSLAQAKR